MKMFLTIAATLTMAVSASPAMAQGYGGNWPLTVTNSQFANGTYCLTLTENGAPHSGSASLVGGGLKLNFGSFVVIDRILVVTLQKQLGSQNGGFMLIDPAHGGTIGKGIYELVAGGSDFDMGAVVYGTKGGCGDRQLYTRKDATKRAGG
jgi:hypothetical protein